MPAIARSIPDAPADSSRGISSRAFATCGLIVKALFGIALCWCASTADAGAAEASVTVSLSPESARMIRDWRRAHGLPQAPEEDAQTPSRRHEAMVSALRLAGVEH